MSKAFLETPDGVAAIDNIQQILRDSNRIEVFTAACQAMCDMDLRPWLPRITSPALVLGGDEDLMTPWDQGPDGAGQQAIVDGISGAENKDLTQWTRMRLDQVAAVLAEREWLVASRFTVADILMADVLRVPRVRAFAASPVIEAYIERACARCSRTIAVSLRSSR